MPINADLALHGVVRAAEAAEALAELSPTAASALQALRRAGQPAETAAQLLTAFDIILAEHTGQTISAAVFAAMIDALRTAGVAALDVLHASLLRAKIDACAEAAAGLICFWALSPAERRFVLAGAHTDSVALVRIFRNTLESLILVEQLHASAAARRQTIVDRIKAEALGASSMTRGVA